MIALRFLRGWRMYNGGEVATFSPDVAAELERDGIAERADAEPVEARQADGEAQAEAPKRQRGRAG